MTSIPDSVQTQLTSDDYGDRLSALNSLRAVAPEAAFVGVLSLIKDPHVRVRYAAVSQMDSVGHVDPQQSLEVLRDRLINDPETDVRAAAADAIGALKLTEGFEDLKKAYEQSSDWLFQMSVVACLGELGDPRSFEILESALTSPEGLVQLAAISSLGELGDPKAIPLLANLLHHEDWQVRQRLVQAFAAFKTDEAQQYLVELAQDEMAQVADYAKEYL